MVRGKIKSQLHVLGLCFRLLHLYYSKLALAIQIFILSHLVSLKFALRQSISDPQASSRLKLLLH